MAEGGPSSTPRPSSAAPGETTPEVLGLRVISPSRGVPTPLQYSGLPVTTTVRQVKEKLREALTTSNPAEVRLRLIHRGRVLDAEEATLLDVFGAAAIRESNEQTLHLVLRDPPPAGPQTSRPGGQDGASEHHGHRHPNPQQPHHHHHHHHNPRLGTGSQTPPFPPGQMPSPFGPHQQPAAMNPQAMAQQHQTMVQWMNQLQREAAYRMINSNQRERAAMGFNGVQDAPRSTPASQTATPAQGSPSAPQTHTFVREAVGPNGQHFRVTVNETIVGSPLQLGNMQPNQATGRSPVGGAAPQAVGGQGRAGLSAMDVHNILRSADATQATQAMTNAMHRSASGASLPSLAGGAAGPVGVTVPMSLRQSLSRAASRTATPEPGSGAAPHAGRSHPGGGQPEVYILSSPTGPRALLINNNAEAFYTPSVRPAAFQMPLPHTFSMQGSRAFIPRMQTPQPSPGGPDILEQWRQNGLLHQQLQQQAPQQAQAQVQPQPPRGEQGDQVQQGAQQDGHAQLRALPAGQALRPNNPGAGALAAIWPHVWLLLRLVLFVWWFTSPNSSWSRWATVISLAIAVFIINTGLLDGIANQAWGPFRRHLEGLIPLADPNQPRAAAAAVPAPAARQAQHNDDVVPAVGAPPRQQNPAVVEPNPAEAAARLVERRRNANANWLMDQVRRMERAGLLFLASIAPGVAERHIAHLEAEARAERQRREAEEAAAAAAAAAVPGDGENEHGGPEAADPIGEEDAAANRLEDERPREEEPLIVF